MPQLTCLAKSSNLRKLAALAMLLLVAIILGCMSLSFGERTVTYAPPDGPPSPSVPSDGVLFEQEGATRVPADGTRTIYYPIPYASPPNLVLTNNKHQATERFEIVEQRADRFTVRNTDWAWAHSAQWVAKGARPAPPQPSPASGGPAILPPPSPAPDLPPQPVPVDGSSPPAAK